MTKMLSPLKALKVGLSSLVLTGACLLSTCAVAQYVKTNGSQIVDENGRPLFFNGTNLGNWLVWEGYMMMDDSKERNGVEYRTHSQFFMSMQAALGNDFDKAREFERLWRLNYVTEETIDELIGLGYNSVRVPFNFRLFWDEETNKPSWEGFEYIDNLISYCRGKNMRILLDMHGAPGYQNPGDHSDNMDSNSSHPVETARFLDGTDGGYHGTSIGANVRKAADVWKHIADYYKNEPIIWGYDLLNEPVTKNKSEDLWRAYRYMIQVIRQVDENHTMVVEGDNWASYMDMFGFGRPQLDSNLVLETHHYVFGDENKTDELYGRATLANNLNLPIIIGEIGEDREEILKIMADIGKEKYDGVFSWSFKKIFKEHRSLWIIRPDTAYAEDRAYINLRDAIDKNTTMEAISGGGSTFEHLKSFLTNNIRNNHSRLAWWHPFYEATSVPISDPTPPSCATRSAFTSLSLPGTVQAEDFDIGCSNVTHLDSTSGNAGEIYRATDVDIASTLDNGATGYYVGWTTGGEWLEYTVDVPQAGSYVFTYRVATPYSGTTITINSGSSSAITNLPVTGGWEIWADAVSTPVILSAGKQVIRLTFTSGLNLNSVTVKANSNIISGTYAIISKATNKALEVEDGYDYNSAIVQQWSYYGLPHQKWRIIPDGDAYKIIDFHSGKALDVKDNYSANGTTVQIWDYASVPNQRWKITYNGAKNTYSIISVATDKALDVPDGNALDGLAMQIWDFHPDNINQEWELKPQ